MQPVPGRGGKRNPAVSSATWRVIEQALNDEREQQRQRDEEGKDRDMKPERLHSAAEPVVDCEQCRNERAIRLIARERAESRSVAEEERNISQVLNGRVCFDRVRVVEVETVVKMVCVRRKKSNQQESGAWPMIPVAKPGACAALWEGV